MGLEIGPANSTRSIGIGTRTDIRKARATQGGIFWPLDRVSNICKAGETLEIPSQERGRLVKINHSPPWPIAQRERARKPGRQQREIRVIDWEDALIDSF